MRDRALLFVLSMSLSVAAQAQVIWQPTPVPLVTAENTSWFSRGEPVHWNGDLYYPTRPVQHFNQYHMVRTGSFNGIPLYIDPMLEAGTIVFVPLSGGLVQPYERRQPAETLLVTDAIRQAPAAPSRAASYDALVDLNPVSAAPLRSMSELMAVGTSGRTAALGAEASAKTAPRRLSTLNPPTGLNAIWVNYDGRRWFLAGKAIDYDAATLAEVGTYHGWSVYTRNGNPSTIYIPTTPGRLAPYTAR